MKKLLAFALCLSLLMTGLVGCVQQGDPSSSDGASSGVLDESTPSSDTSTTGNSAADQTTSATVSGTDTTGSTAVGSQPSGTSGKTQGGTTTTKQPGGSSVTPAIKSNWSGNTVELLTDPQFLTGFKTSALINTEGYVGQVDFFDKATPQWELSQWYSNESIKDVKKVVNGNTATYSNQYKTLSLKKNADSTTTLTLTCNGRAEYGGEKPSSDFYGWVHYGAGQYLRESPKLSELSSLRLTMTTQMLPIKNASSLDPNAGGGVSQYNITFIIKNTNEDSEDCNEYIWAQVCIYDSRYDLPPAYCGVDGGVAESSGQYIYTIAADRVLDEPFGNGKEAKIDFDWLPVFKEALEAVQARGAMKNTKWSDMEVLTFGFGYEVGRGEDYTVITTAPSLKATYADGNTYAKPVVGKSYNKGFTVAADWKRPYGEWKFADGVLSMTEATQWNHRISLASQYYVGNYDIEWEMSLDERYSSKDCWAGISFGKQFMQDDHGLSGNIMFVYPSGKTYVSHFVNKTGGEGQIAGFELKKFYKYKIEVRGDTATLYVNGKKICSGSDVDIADGGYISIISGLAKCSFKNFKVTVK